MGGGGNKYKVGVNNIHPCVHMYNDIICKLIKIILLREIISRCEVVVSGKLRGQRAKAMKFVDGLMIHSGDPMNDYVDQAVRHVLLRQGVLGIKVSSK